MSQNQMPGQKKTHSRKECGAYLRDGDERFMSLAGPFAGRVMLVGSCRELGGGGSHRRRHRAR